MPTSKALLRREGVAEKGVERAADDVSAFSSGLQFRCERYPSRANRQSLVDLRAQGTSIVNAHRVRAQGGALSTSPVCYQLGYFGPAPGSRVQRTRGNVGNATLPAQGSVHSLVRVEKVS